jgi:hypothetical protein
MQLVDDAARPADSSPRLLEATFLDTATTDADALRVVIPSYDAGQHYWPVVWQPRANAGGPLFPHAGDRALVALSERERAWVVCWSPASLLTP